MNGAAPQWTATVLTLFPGMFPGPLGASLAGKALESGIWALETVDIRDFASDKHASVDDSAFGGGPGMVMRADVLARAIDAASPGDDGAPRILLTRAAGRSTSAACGIWRQPAEFWWFVAVTKGSTSASLRPVAWKR